MRKKDTDLHGATILVAEDNPVIGMEIAGEIEDAGGIVVGPADTVEETEALVASEHVQGAVLGYKFDDGDINGVAEDLTEQDAAIVLQTGDVPPRWKERFPKSAVVKKPYQPGEVAETLAGLIHEKPRAGDLSE